MGNTSSASSRDPTGIIAVLLASTVWGASFVLAKVALRELSVTHVVLYRFVLAAVPLLPVLVLSRERLDPRDVPLLALTGFLMVPVTIFLQFGGLALTDATSTALMVGVGPPLLAVAAVLFERERLGAIGWIAIGVSTLGVAVLVGSPGEGADLLGNLLVLTSIMVSVVWILTSKRLAQRYSAFFATGWIIVMGTAFLVPIALVHAGWPPMTLSRATWLSLLALGLGCTVAAYAAWNWGVARIGAGSAGIWLNLEPVTGALLGIVLLGDPLTGGTVAGGLLILGAAGMVSVAPVGAASAGRVRALDPLRKAPALHGRHARRSAPRPVGS